MPKKNQRSTPFSQYAIVIIAACTVRELVDDSNQKMGQLKELWCAKNDTHKALGDLLVLLSALGATENSKVLTEFFSLYKILS